VRRLAFGVALDSDLVLAGAATDRRADVTVRETRGPIEPSAIDWLDQDSDPFMSAGRVGGDFYLRFGDEAEFRVGADGRSVRWHASAAAIPTH
jgi:hypothetical protein